MSAQINYIALLIDLSGEFRSNYLNENHVRSYFKVLLLQCQFMVKETAKILRLTIAKS